MTEETCARCGHSEQNHWGGPSSQDGGDHCRRCDCRSFKARAAMTEETQALERYGVTWTGEKGTPLHAPMPDGYWTPWHLAAAALTALARDLETADKCNDILKGEVSVVRQERDAALTQRNAFDRECKRLRAAAREGQ